MAAWRVFSRGPLGWEAPLESPPPVSLPVIELPLETSHMNFRKSSGFSCSRSSYSREIGRIASLATLRMRAF